MTTLLLAVKDYWDNIVAGSKGLLKHLLAVKGYWDNTVVHSEGLQGQHCCTQ